MVPRLSKLILERQTHFQQTSSLENMMDSLLWGPLGANFLRAEPEQCVEAGGSLISSPDDRVNFPTIRGVPH